MPQPSSSSEETGPEPATAEAPDVDTPDADSPNTDVKVEAPAPDSGAGMPPAAPAPDTNVDNPAETEPLTVTQVLGVNQQVPVGVPGSWHLVFDDEFDTLNTAVWTPYWFNDCNPKSLKNNVKTCSSNVRVANGEAVLQLSDDESGALLSTNPKDGAPGHTGFEFTEGYVEARIYFSGSCGAGIHNWAAWWTVGQQFPRTGEIDIAEPLAGDMWSVYHSGAGKKSRLVPGCWAGGYHTYGLHRKAGQNDIYYDGILVHSYASKDGNSPHYLLLNVGNWSGPRILGDAGNMRVDYVRVWK
ncbi:glycoside hydrolase family 16 protein [Arthrobacter sp. B3I4]|uniref:glycoside hydrolase family 16 protein n=1 Tax=Arthrobacter sp. B3I4 TaxID=3042267 RepID=UPI002785B4D1|nr:glycoside hydrolase family 16 protein [Arthrobacter sp. B3I4]MDQ0757270.1 beta-glucanase (GH16 family) [Arthrobacter sp. B3I4]